MKKTLYICDRCDGQISTNFQGLVGGIEFDLCETCFGDFKLFWKKKSLEAFGKEKHSERYDVYFKKNKI